MDVPDLVPVLRQELLDEALLALSGRPESPDDVQNTQIIAAVDAVLPVFDKAIIGQIVVVIQWLQPAAQALNADALATAIPIRLQSLREKHASVRFVLRMNHQGPVVHKPRNPR